ncbi:MAG: M20/M25/M40 family metallo-hydrolase [Spirochaetales bacterium]|nr:M20/M25/M40 family metallo-hydrolase [Spirochaetales bacterium]
MSNSSITEEKLVPLLQELIRNKCVNTGHPDSGQEIKSAKTLRRFFNDHGIKSEILEAHPGRANLLARIPGTDPGAPTLCFMNHMDVVPANESQWSVDPFGGDLRGGFVWGRGAVDMLNTTASQAVAFAMLAQEKKNFPGDLLFLAVADEEASGRLGARWLTEHHWDKIKSDYMITELGGFFLNNTNEQNITITTGEKGIAWTRIQVKGEAGHGSLPYNTHNTAYVIGEALQRLSSYKPKLELTREYCDMVAALHLPKKEQQKLTKKATLMKSIKHLAQTDEGTARFLHAASQMTISPNVVEVGKKINIIPDHGSIELDIRILPGQTVETVLAELTRALGNIAKQFEIEILEYFPSNTSPLDTPLYQATCELIGAVYPLACPVPFFIGSVTDGRFFRKKGTIVYGFSLFHDELTLSEYARRLHGKNERISVKSLELSCNYFYKLPEIFFNKTHLSDNM